jgi:hypothetical protein
MAFSLWTDRFHHIQNWPIHFSFDWRRGQAADDEVSRVDRQLDKVLTPGSSSRDLGPGYSSTSASSQSKSQR